MTHFFQTTLVAAVLAGGKARRMGGLAKGNLIVREDGCYNFRDYRKNGKIECVDDITIMQHLLDAITRAGIEKTIIVTNDTPAYATYKVTLVADLWKNFGPIAGIASALDFYHKQNPPATALLIVPCDLPNFSACEIIRLNEAYNASPTAPIAYAATTHNETHPLCAIINCNILPQLKNAITHGERKVMALWQQLGAKAVIFDCADEAKFRNVNTLKRKTV